MKKYTNSDIDTYLKEEFEESNINIPESYYAKIDEILNNLPKKSHKSIFRARILRPALIILACTVLVTAGTSAGVKLYLKRLNSIDRNEIEHINDMIQEYKYNEKYTYTRPLTEEERNREEKLEKEYEDGRFPAQKMTVYQKISEVKEGEFCFCYENSCVYMPQEELSDEQLLQLIDLNYTRDYALTEVNKDWEDTIPKSDKEKVTKKKAKKIIKDFIEDLYGVNISKVDSEIEIKRQEWWYTEKDYIPEWHCEIEWTTDQNYYVYADINAESGEILYFDYLEKYDYSESMPDMKDLKLKEEKYTENKEAVLNIAKIIMPNVEFKDILMCYCITEDNKLYAGNVTYYFLDDNGKGCEVDYNYNYNKIDYLRTDTDIEKERESIKEIIKNGKEMGIILKYKERKI